MARNTLPQNYTINSGTLFEGFQTIGDWTRGSAAGSIAEDTTHFTTGDKSLSVVFASGTSVFYDKTINTVVNGGVSSMVLKVYVPSLTNLGSIALYIASASNYSKYFSVTIQGASLHEGYNYIVIAPSQWTNTGTESWANTMVRLRIRINATTGTPSVSFCSIHTGEYSRPKVLVTFDDSWASQYTEGYTYMATKGLKGTIYTINSKVDTSGYMTSAQLQTVYAAGWDIGLHGLTNYTTLADQTAVEADIQGCIDFLNARSLFRANRHLALPNGGYNDTVIAAMDGLGILTARTIIDRNQANYLDDKNRIARQGVYNTTTQAATKAFVDLAIAQGSSVWLNYHILVAADADVSTKVLNADFEAVIDYIKTKVDANQLDVVTISEWYNGLTNPRTTATRSAASGRSAATGRSAV